jgi:serine/threonine protein kinase
MAAASSSSSSTRSPSVLATERAHMQAWLDETHLFTESKKVLETISKVSGKLINKGSHGSVYEFELSGITPSKYVIKHIYPKKEKDKVRDEVGYFYEASKEGISPPYFGSLVFNTRSGYEFGYLISEKGHMDGFEYMGFWYKNKDLTLDDAISYIFFVTLQANRLKTLTGLEHTDIKPENTLVNLEETKELKWVYLIDFENLGKWHYGSPNYFDPTSFGFVSESRKDLLDQKNTWSLMVATINFLTQKSVFCSVRMPRSKEDIFSEVTASLAYLRDDLAPLREKIQTIALDTLTMHRKDRLNSRDFSFKLALELGSEVLLKKLKITPTIDRPLKEKVAD